MKEYTIHERTQYFPACVRTQNGAIDRWPKDVKHRLQNGIGRKSWRSLVSARRDSLRTTPCHLLSLGTKHFTNKVQVSYLSWSTRGLQKKSTVIWIWGNRTLPKQPDAFSQHFVKQAVDELAASPTPLFRVRQGREKEKFMLYKEKEK